jgi:hypothetical protein
MSEMGDNDALLRSAGELAYRYRTQLKADAGSYR